MARGKAGPIRIGVGGWTFEPWRGTFFPDGLPHRRELEHASRQFGSIEINGTFYGAQTPETFGRWHDEVPDDFVFAVKGPRFATNRRVLAEAAQSIDRFFASGVARLAGKLGPINWQLSPHKQFDRDDLAAFLSLLPDEADGVAIRHALEVRHPSFADSALAAIAAKRGVAVVLAGDSPHPEIDAATAPFAYVRMMGTREDQPVGYGDAELDGWAGRLRRLAADGRPVFAYVIGGFKQRNPLAALALQARIAASSPGSRTGA